MATYTQNYQLEKPAVSEFYDVAIANANMDKIDSTMKDTDSAAVKTSGNQTISGTKTFEQPVVLNGAPTENNHAVRLQDLNNANNANNYSKDEQIIGKWIDEKPLYRQCIFLNEIDSSKGYYEEPEPIIINNLNFFTKICIVANIYNYSQNIYSSMPIFDASKYGNVSGVVIYRNDADNENEYKIYFDSLTEYWKNIVIILEYTKTTN